MSHETFLKNLKDCENCELKKTAFQPVPGHGPIPNKIMFIGEAPGRDEDLQGLPFVGAAGKVLTKCLINAGINREQVYITNVVKHRPPENRIPSKEEVSSCGSWLDWEINNVNPSIIVCLGNSSVNRIFEKFGITKQPISMIRGTPIKIKTITGQRIIFPTFHPAATIYNQSLKETFIQDLRKILTLI